MPLPDEPFCGCFQSDNANASQLQAMDNFNIRRHLTGTSLGAEGHLQPCMLMQTVLILRLLMMRGVPQTMATPTNVKRSASLRPAAATAHQQVTPHTTSRLLKFTQPTQPIAQLHMAILPHSL